MFSPNEERIVREIDKRHEQWCIEQKMKNEIINQETVFWVGVMHISTSHIIGQIIGENTIKK